MADFEDPDVYQDQHSFFLEYRRRIKEGEIFAGRELIAELDNLAADMQSPDYVYDMADAGFRIRFIEKFCRHTKSPFFGKPFALELWEKAFIEVFFSFKVREAGLRRFKKALLLVGRKNGKANQYLEKVPTPTGWRIIGDLQPGDYVYSEFGKPVKVLDVSPVYLDHDCYALDFEDGEHLVADTEHLWLVSKKAGQKYQILTTGEMAQDFAPGKYTVPLPVLSTPLSTTTVEFSPVLSTAHLFGKESKAITAITCCPTVPVKCIAVDNPTGLFLVGRKMTVTHNSTFCAALSLAEFFCGRGGVDIVCSSNDDVQANIIFSEINSMREWSPALKKRSHKNLKGIFHLKHRSSITKLSDKTRNKEGRNIDMGILDEAHEMKDNVIGKSIEQSQSTKDEPIMMIITTEGFVNDGYLDAQLKYARGIINGDIEDPTWLPWLYTQDSEAEIWQDERTWQKSNPSLGPVKKPAYIYDQIRVAQQDKAERAFMLAKDFNIKQNEVTAWLLEQEYINPETCPLENLVNSVALGAVDLAETTDLACAKALIMKPGDPKKYFLTQYFIPENKITLGAIEDKKNYLDWARQGLVTVSPGNENDFSMITTWFVKLFRQYGIRFFKIGFDNALARFWITEMEDYGFDMEKVTQDRRTLSGPMKLLEADLRSKLVVYNHNPIDEWCLGNTAMKIDNFGQILPVKVNDQKNRRIDGAVTKIIAYAMYTRYRTEYLQALR